MFVFCGLLVFGFIVFIHEMGHYLAARWRGVEVHAFSVGFGPALFSWKDRVGTEWKISLLPLGGYVKMSVDEENENSLQKKSLLSRAIVTVAGPAFNALLTVVMFTLILSLYGKPEIKREILQVAPNGPAEKAGLQVGDRIDFINNQKMLDGAAVEQILYEHPGETVSLNVFRKGHDVALSATLERFHEKEGFDTGRLGIELGIGYSSGLPVYKAVPDALMQTVQLAGDMYVGLWKMLTGQVSLKEVSGTIGIVKMSGDAAQSGMISLMAFVAMISLNLCVLNLLPIPVLDGGHLMFDVCEAIRGKPLSPKIMAIASWAGIGLLAVVFLFSTANDMNNTGITHFIVGLFK